MKGRCPKCGKLKRENKEAIEKAKQDGLQINPKWLTASHQMEENLQFYPLCTCPDDNHPGQ